jgi:hypothetical protein
MDAKRKLDLDGTVQTATGQAGAESNAELSLKGRLEGQPLSLRFVGGSALMLRETDKPYPINLDVAYSDTKLAVKGSLQDPFRFFAVWCGLKRPQEGELRSSFPAMR